MQEVEAALLVLKRQSDSGTFDKLSAANVMGPPPTAVSLPARRRGPGRAIAATVVLLFAAGGATFWATSHGDVPQQPRVQPPVSAATPPREDILTNDKIVEMVGERVTPSLIISQIRASKANFNMSAAEVIPSQQGRCTRRRDRSDA